MDNQDSIQKILNWFKFSQSEKEIFRNLFQQKDNRIMKALEKYIKEKNTPLFEDELVKILVEVKIKEQEKSNSQSKMKHFSQLIDPSNETSITLENTNIIMDNNSNIQNNITKHQNISQINNQNQQNLNHQIQSTADNLTQHQNSLPQSYVKKYSNGQNEDQESPIVQVKTTNLNKFFQEQKSGSKQSPKIFDIKEFEIDYQKNHHHLSHEYRIYFIDYVKNLSIKDIQQQYQTLGLNQLNIKIITNKFKQKFLELSQNNYRGVSFSDFVQIMCGTGQQSIEKIYSFAILFFFLDIDQNGILEIHEIILGLIFASTDDKNDKIESVFIAFDKDNSQNLDEQELTLYFNLSMNLNSRLKVSQDIQKKQENTFQSQQLAQKIFNQLDQRKEISLQEFILWNESLENEQQGGESWMVTFRQKLERENFNLANKELKFNLINEIRQQLQFENIKLSEVMKIFRQSKQGERLQFKGFINFVEDLLKSSGIQHKFNKKQFNVIMMDLFSIFDIDHNNVVDWIELLTGICLLCGGSSKEKIRVLFDLYDINEDGVLSFKELYLLLDNNMKIIFQDNPELLKQFGSEMTSGQIAFITTKKAYDDLQLKYEQSMDPVQFEIWMRKTNRVIL